MKLYVLVNLGLLLFNYLTFSFITLSLSPYGWSINQRTDCVVMDILSLILVNSLLMAKSNSDRNKIKS